MELKIAARRKFKSENKRLQSGVRFLERFLN